MFKLKYGKKAASSDSRDLRFENYRIGLALPPIPAQFGHEALIPRTGWGMLGNDQYGDCVWAGAAHETMLFNREANVTVDFSQHNVLKDYSAVTGFNPHDPESDQGTDTRDAMKYRQKTGVLDAAGKRHTIGAYLAIDPKNLAHLYEAIYLFGAVGLGIQVPTTAQEQFTENKPWDVVPHASIEGGHYVPLVAKRSTVNFTPMPICITWGRQQPVTEAFLHKYADEAFAIVSLEALTNGKTLEGFDMAQLQADLKNL